MNFLAHAYLARHDAALMVGGVVGDWIKGPLPAGLPPDLARGVALHRAIDAHAERHPAFRASRARVSPERRRYAGVLVDIFYDHLLARDWCRFHDADLSAYTAALYAQIHQRHGELPEAATFALGWMAREDWLAGYGALDAIADVLRRMGQRARQPNPLAGGEVEFLADPAGYATDFGHWLEEAQRFVAGWLDAN